MNLYDPISMQPLQMHEPVFAKQPSTLEALRQRSKPLYMGIDSYDYRQQPDPAERLRPAQEMNTDQAQSEFPFQFKKLKPFN